jgi:hypothetical protein
MNNNMNYSLTEPFDFSDGVNVTGEEEKEYIDRAIIGLLEHRNWYAYNVQVGNLLVIAMWGTLNAEGTKRRMDVLVSHNYIERHTQEYFDSPQV